MFNIEWEQVRVYVQSRNHPLPQVDTLYTWLNAKASVLNK